MYYVLEKMTRNMKRFGAIFAALCAGLMPVVLGAVSTPIAEATKPKKIELRDFSVNLTPIHDSKSVEIEVVSEVFKPLDDVSISGIRGVADFVAKLYDDKGEEVASSPVERLRLSTQSPITTIRQKFTFDSPTYWSAETPASYVVVAQVDRDIKARSVVFRDDHQRDRAVLRAIRVSSADFEGGVEATKEEIDECLTRLKQANFNAVLDGGDLPTLFVPACDSYGLYIITNNVQGVMSYGELGPLGSASFEEAKFQNRPIKVACKNAASSRALLKNLHTSISASEYVANYSLTKDGVEVASGSFELPPIAAGAHDFFDLPQPEIDAYDSESEYLYNLAFLRRSDAPGLPAGYEVMHCQLPFEAKPTEGESVSESATAENGKRVCIRMKSNDEEKVVEVEAGSTKAVFDSVNKRFSSLSMNGKEILAPGELFGFFVEGMGEVSVRPKDLRINGNAVIVVDEVLSESEAGYGRTTRWQFFEDGKVRVELELEPLAKLPAKPGSLGFKWKADDLAQSKISYYGRGPWANHPWNCSAASVALYSGEGASLSGMRSQVRSFSVVDPEGRGVEVKVHSPFVLVFGEELKMVLSELGTQLKAEKWTIDLKAVEEKKKSSWWFF